MQTSYSVEKLKRLVPNMDQQQIEKTISEIEKDQKLYNRFDVYTMYILLYKRAEAIKSGKKMLY